MKKHRQPQNTIGQNIVNLEELQQLPIFKKAQKQRKRKNDVKAKAKTLRERNSKLLMPEQQHPTDALKRLDQLTKSLNRAPIGKMSMTYNKDMMLERVKVKSFEYVPFLTNNFTGLMKVAKGTTSPIMEVSLKELYQEFGDRDVVSDMYQQNV
jgi:hypothetical protein